MSQIVQPEYNMLDQFVRIFADHHDHTRAIARTLETRFEALSSGDWIGQNAEAFNQAMVDEILPAFERLANAFIHLENTTGKLAEVFASAEEDAAKLLQHDRAGAVYTVKAGDTLWAIARRHNTTVDQLVQANHLENRDRLSLGQTIKIPEGGNAMSAPEPVRAPAPSPPRAEAFTNASRSPEELNAAIDRFNVAGNDRYRKFRDGNPDTYDTYCNLFAADVAKSFDAPLPLFVTDTEGAITKWLGAENMKRWLDGRLDVPGHYTQGPQNGWMKVDTADAVRAANSGHLTVAAGHGHMAVVRAGSSVDAAKGDVLIAQAGKYNFNNEHLKNGWGRYTDEAEFYVFKPD